MGASERKLMAIPSDPKNFHMYHGENFASLMDVVNSLIINLCNGANSLGRPTVQHLHIAIHVRIILI